MTVAEALERLQKYPLEAEIKGPGEAGPAPLRRFFSSGTEGAEVDDAGAVTYATTVVVTCEFGDDMPAEV